MSAGDSNVITPANHILFGDLCEVFKQLYKRRKQRAEQDKILTKFINDFRLKVANFDGKKNSTFFPVLRLILPTCERERGPYNLKETKLGNLLVKVLSLNKHSADANKLLCFQSVDNAIQDSDFAGVVYMVLKNRVTQCPSSLSVKDVNEILDKIAKPCNEGNHGAIFDEIFSYAIKNMTAEQFKWFLRIILKDMKLGMSIDRVLAIFHPDAPVLFTNCSNIMKVCEELEDGDTRPSELGVRLFYAVRPMLSEQLDVAHVQKLPANKQYVIEDKFDGERFQMHMEDGKFEYFSRKGYPYSKNYGKDYETGLLTPYLKHCFSKEACSFILDGEMMGWHKKRQRFGSKGMAYDIKKVTDNSTFRPCYCVFDILYYNGKSLVGAEDNGGICLSKRFEILDTLFKDIPGVIQLSKRRTVKESSDISNALDKVIEDDDEGIVVKDVNSYYVANCRNAGWYKIKPECTDLDLVIIGADEAENKSRGRAKSFHVACIDSTPNEPTRWVCVGRVSSGLSFDETERLCTLLQKNWQVSRKSPIPPCLIFNKETPDLWVLPEHSIALEVRATELVRSSGFGTEYTLRFQRVQRVRADKPVRDVITLAEFNQLVATREPVIKLSKKRISESQIEQINELELKMRRSRTSKPKPQVPEQFRSNRNDPATTASRNDPATTISSNALLNRELCVISDNEALKKSDLISIIESHGGKHVENAGSNTWCCIVGNLTSRQRLLIKTQKYDVITASWLSSLPKSSSPCSLSPLDMLSIKKSTKLNMSYDFDTFGDSYTEEVDEDTLKKCFLKMDMEPSIYLTTKEKLKLDKQLFDDNNPSSFLRGCTLHIQGNTLNKLLAKMYGAQIIEDNTKIQYCTHLILSKEGNSEYMAAIQKYFLGKIVTDKWLAVCFENKYKVLENEYLL